MKPGDSSRTVREGLKGGKGWKSRGTRVKKAYVKLEKNIKRIQEESGRKAKTQKIHKKGKKYQIRRKITGRKKRKLDRQKMRERERDSDRKR